MKRRRKQNPSPIVIGAVVLGVAAVGGVVFFVLKGKGIIGAPAGSLLTNTSSSGGGVAQFATVTTSDPAPAGDLIIRSGPDDSAAQIGGAEKDGQVTVLDANASPTYAQIVWTGGSRLPAAQGFAHKAFLVPV